MSTLNDTMYDSRFQVFNSERRTSTGTTWVRANPDNMYNCDFEGGTPFGEETGFKFRNMQKYTLNLTGHTDSNPLKVTIFTYANGVKWVEEWAYDIVDNETYIGKRSYYEDKDGHYIDVNTYTGRIMTDTPDSAIFHSYNIGDIPLSGVTYYYGTPGYIYSGDPSRDAYSLMGNGIEFIARPTASPYDRPELVGDLDEGYVENYYWGPLYHDLWKQEWIDLLYECLEKKGDGTPIIGKKPEDDTSTPDPDPDPDYNPFTDPIDYPDLPTGGDTISTGMVKVYAPTTAQLQNLASVLWSDDFVNTLKKIHNDPMEAVISLHSLPVQLVGTPSVCQIGNFDTEVAMNAVTTQFYTISLGSIYIPEHWASALDYSPYVDISCFIPYVGVRPLQVDDIVGKTIEIKANVDIISGATVIFIKCGSSVLYTFNADIMFKHPLSMSSMGPLYQAIAGAVASAAQGGAQGGGAGAVGGAIGGALNVALSKWSQVTRSGNIGTSFGCLASFTPYLIIHRPIQSLAAGFRHFKGYPSNITATLGSLSGYTEVESVHLEGLSCTDRERDEIMALLYNGVIF